MKAKTINIILCRKFDAWLASIEDESVKSLVARNTIITGGAIASMLLNEKVNDFDVYFRNHTTALAVANYYVAKFLENPPNRFKNSDRAIEIRVDSASTDRIKIHIKSAGIASDEGTEDYQYFEMRDPSLNEAENYVDDVMASLEDINNADKEHGEGKFKPVFMSSNAITLSDRIQLVFRFFGEPEEIHENYDFAHCTNYWDSKTRKVVLKPKALECLLTKELRYIGSRYPLCSVIRTRKFISRGWTINAGQYLKMLMQLNSMDLLNVSVLEDQLIGVDTAYFTELVRKLRENDPEKVNTAYLIEIIDRMF